MKKRFFTILAAMIALALMFTGCGSKSDLPPEEEQTEAKPASGQGKASPEETMQVRLEDDYYDYINGKMLSKVKIPDDAGGWSQFYRLDREAYEVLNEVLRESVSSRKGEAEGSLEQKIADLYLTGMDMEGRKKASFGALQPYIDRIRDASDINQYMEAVGMIYSDLGTGSILMPHWSEDMKDSSQYALYVTSADLGPGKETIEDQTQTDMMESYKDYIARTLIFAGADGGEANKSAQEILDLQKDLAKSTLTLSRQNDPDTVYNLYTQNQLVQMVPEGTLGAFLTAGGIQGLDAYVVTEENQMRKISSYLTPQFLPLLKNYSIFCLVNDFSPYLTPEIKDSYLEWNNLQKGILEKKTDEKMVSEITQNTLGFEFGNLYVEKCFSIDDKIAIEKMAHQILDAYKNQILALDWMGDETKKAALKKLNNMKLKIGYPDHWPNDYEEASVVSKQEGGIFIDNILALIKTKQGVEKEKVRNPVDKSEWGMTPQTVNAYYNPNGNEIVFPAALLQEPFYDSKASFATNLGGIGMVIAHEVSHAFDSSGSLYDENGNYHEWWTKKDREKFKQRADQVVSYYSELAGYEGRNVNGEQTLDENIADLGALACITSIAENQGLDLKPLFQQYAIIWASKYTKEAMIQRLNTDVHSPAKVRVNGVLSSTDAFYQVYPDIKEGDEMYVPPELRVKIW